MRLPRFARTSSARVVEARLLYSLIGSLGTASAFVPPLGPSRLAPTALWAPLHGPVHQGWARGLAPLANNMGAFRPYLGEWRRLFDQAATRPGRHAATTLGLTRAVRLRAAPVLSGVAPARKGSSKTQARQAGRSPAYTAFLTTP